MFVEVQAFNDETRVFETRSIRKANVNAINPTVTKLYGEAGAHECVKVWMAGYSFWMAAADVSKVTS